MKTRKHFIRKYELLAKRRIDSKSSPHFTIEVKSDTEVIFKVHKKVQFNQ